MKASGLQKFLLALMLGVLLARLNGYLFILCFLLFWEVLIFRSKKKRQEMIQRSRAIFLQQKHQAEERPMPDPMELYVAVCETVAQNTVSRAEMLDILVNFGCRLSVSNLFGQTVHDLEDERFKASYQVEIHPLGEEGDVFELPGIRGGEKDKVGRYRFWRTADAVCFGLKEEEGGHAKLPLYIIPFNVQTQTPTALLKLRESYPHLAVYEPVWGDLPGKKVRKYY